MVLHTHQSFFVEIEWPMTLNYRFFSSDFSHWWEEKQGRLKDLGDTFGANFSAMRSLKMIAVISEKPLIGQKEIREKNDIF